MTIWVMFAKLAPEAATVMRIPLEIIIVVIVIERNRKREKLEMGLKGNPIFHRFYC